MRIDGKSIALEIKKELKIHVEKLQNKNIFPHLFVILIGDDPASVTYVGQKQKVAGEIGVKLSLCKEVGPLDRLELITKVSKLNRDSSVHGIIIQKPVPLDIEKEELDKLVTVKKDVDGFHPDSPFMPPVASAVLKIIEWVSKDCCSNMESPLKQNYCQPFYEWLKEKRILIIGRGETAGKPIAETLQKIGVPFKVAHSKTTNINELCLVSNIIISCVGRPNVVRHNMISSKTVLIGVGLHSENGKLQTDYNQKDLAGIASYYTPVPGGVGPVNVACLFENLLKSV